MHSAFCEVPIAHDTTHGTQRIDAQADVFFAVRAITFSGTTCVA